MSETKQRKNAKAFTLIELLAVVLIIGILMILAVAQYLKSSERGKATTTIAQLSMLANANRGFSLDHKRSYANGPITAACNTASCQGTGTPCDLVACGYITVQDWDKLPYNYYALVPGGSTAACGLNGVPPGYYVACAARKVCAGSGGNCVDSGSNYAQWGYLVTTDGTFQRIPTSGSTAPPAAQ